MKTFIAAIEEEPAMAFEIEWEGDTVPMHIKFPDGSMIAKVGQYLSPGDRYCFRRVEPVEIEHFKIVDFHAKAGS